MPVALSEDDVRRAVERSADVVRSRKTAIVAAGFCTFLNLYSPHALLPELAREFGVGAAEISAIMTASALTIAPTAPFTGAKTMNFKLTDAGYRTWMLGRTL